MKNIKNLNAWINRKYEQIKFCLIQFVTGYGHNRKAVNRKTRMKRQFTQLRRSYERRNK